LCVAVPGLTQERMSKYWGVVLRGKNLKDDTFADDMALLANTIADLQLLLEC
jgi:hypothetical protein